MNILYIIYGCQDYVFLSMNTMNEMEMKMARRTCFLCVQVNNRYYMSMINTMCIF